MRGSEILTSIKGRNFVKMVLSGNKMFTESRKHGIMEPQDWAITNHNFYISGPILIILSPLFFYKMKVSNMSLYNYIMYKVSF